jgi:hypothetical protein
MKLISSLGKPLTRRDSNGRPSASPHYIAARYCSEDGRETPEYQVPLTALVHLYQPTEVIALCTEGAMDAFELFQMEIEEHKEIARPQQITAEKILIPRDRTGLNTIAEAILKHALPGDSIHLDVTFGLRAISYAAFFVAQYAEYTRQARIARLTYVNYEAADGSPDAPKQIMDLTDFLHLPRLAFAADQFRRQGDIAGLAEALCAYDPRAVQMDDARKIQERIETLRTRQISSNNTGSHLIKGLINSLRQRAADLPLLKPIAEEVSKELMALLPPDNLKATSPAGIARLVQWYTAHNHPVHAVLLMDEALAFLCCTFILRHENYPRKHGTNGNEYWKHGEYIVAAQERLRAGTPSRDKLAEDLDRFNECIRDKRNSLAHVGLGTSQVTISQGEINDLENMFSDLCANMQDLAPTQTFPPNT